MPADPPSEWATKLAESTCLDSRGCLRADIRACVAEALDQAHAAGFAAGSVAGQVNGLAIAARTCQSKATSYRSRANGVPTITAAARAADACAAAIHSIQPPKPATAKESPDAE